MATDSAHNRWWQIFEVIFGVPFVAAIALHQFVPLGVARGIGTTIMMVGGVVLVIAGLVLIVQARREFAQGGQPTDPGHATSRIVTTGVFSFSRNPLYLGGVCVLLGIGLVLNMLWVFILLVPALVACHYLLIVPEERYLAAKFGADYQAYAGAVRRWIGRG